MPAGIVKWFDGRKGYGFIQPEGRQPDIFVHMSEVKKSGLQNLDAGDEITFDIKVSERNGRSGASNIKVVAKA